jgi:ectoine hydroxylase-related dioxygenase (phytanoyl-CoA dioxygenase family)
MRLEVEQIQSYIFDGFLLLSDLVDRKTVEEARRALIEHIGRPHENSLHAFVKDPAVSACFNKNICSAATELAGVRKRFAPPSTVYTITVFPTSEPWVWPLPHIDHAREEDAHRTFPAPFSVGCLIYLSDIQSHSGGTVVWPGSHRRLQELAAANPEQYKYLASLNRDISQLDLGSPKEITAHAGGALFYHYLCGHSGSANLGTEPRFALNHKW